jgi:hypothetical protein
MNPERPSLYDRLGGVYSIVTCGRRFHRPDHRHVLTLASSMPRLPIWCPRSPVRGEQFLSNSLDHPRYAPILHLCFASCRAAIGISRGLFLLVATAGANWLPRGQGRA